MRKLVDAAAKVQETFGAIDVWVNDAMVSVFSPVKEITAADYKRGTNRHGDRWPKVILSLLDRYLGRTGYKSQQILGVPRDPNAPNNLYEYVPGVHSARGKFGDRSKRACAEVFITLHRGWFAAADSLAIAAARGAITAKSKGKMTPPHSAADEPRDPAEKTRVMLAGCCIAIRSLISVAMYQVKTIRHLPDPPSEVFNWDAITGSRQAHLFGIPDALLRISSLGATIALVLASRRSVTTRRLLVAKLALDMTPAVFSMTRWAVSCRKLCSWCTVTALATGIAAYGEPSFRSHSTKPRPFLRSEGRVDKSIESTKKHGPRLRNELKGGPAPAVP